MVIIKRIGVGSAFKVGAVLNALAFAILGIPFLLLQGLVLTSLSSINTQYGSANVPNLAGAGIATLCIFYFGGIIFGAIAGGIGAAIYAFLYNLVAGWVGGLEVDLTRNP